MTMRSPCRNCGFRGDRTTCYQTCQRFAAYADYLRVVDPLETRRIERQKCLTLLAVILGADMPPGKVRKRIGAETERLSK